MHPGASAAALKSKIPHAMVHYSVSDRVAYEEWPDVIYNFLCSIRPPQLERDSLLTLADHRNISSCNSNANEDVSSTENIQVGVQNDETSETSIQYNEIDLKKSKSTKELTEYLMSTHIVASPRTDSQMRGGMDGNRFDTGVLPVQKVLEDYMFSMRASVSNETRQHNLNSHDTNRMTETESVSCVSNETKPPLLMVNASEGNGQVQLTAIKANSKEIDDILLRFNLIFESSMASKEASRQASLNISKCASTENMSDIATALTSFAGENTQ